MNQTIFPICDGIKEVEGGQQGSSIATVSYEPPRLGSPVRHKPEDKHRMGWETRKALASIRHTKNRVSYGTRPRRRVPCYFAVEIRCGRVATTSSVAQTIRHRAHPSNMDATLPPSPLPPLPILLMMQSAPRSRQRYRVHDATAASLGTKTKIMSHRSRAPRDMRARRERTASHRTAPHLLLSLRQAPFDLGPCLPGRGQLLFLLRHPRPQGLL